MIVGTTVRSAEEERGGGVRRRVPVLLIEDRVVRSGVKFN